MTDGGALLEIEDRLTRFDTSTWLVRSVDGGCCAVNTDEAVGINPVRETRIS